MPVENAGWYMWMKITLVYVDENHNIVPKYPEESLEGFDLTEVYCLGCSWHGSPKRLSSKYV